MSKLTAKDAIAKVAKGEITLIDVRETSELQASGKAKGALHIPLSLIAMKADPKGPSHDAAIVAGKPIAVYCAVGGRAGMAAMALTQLGYDAQSIGGFADWVQAGGPVTR